MGNSISRSAQSQMSAQSGHLPIDTQGQCSFASLPALPNELKEKIITHLPPESLASLAATNKDFHKVTAPHLKMQYLLQEVRRIVSLTGDERARCIDNIYTRSQSLPPVKREIVLNALNDQQLFQRRSVITG